MSTLNQFVGIGTSLTINTVSTCIEVDFDTTAPLGSRPKGAGGFVICKASGTAWIVAPRCTEIQRTWYSREDAITLANTCTLCTGWFIPTCGQLQNPGFLCKQYYDDLNLSPATASNYWSSTERNSAHAWLVRFTDGNIESLLKSDSGRCVRAYRCVTY
jgi:hypothetical protein